MNSSDLPARITKAFGVNGDKNTIPTDSSTTTDSTGAATFDKGFPPITMIALSAGGIPPSGKDFNGVFYSVSLQQQWQNAGMNYPFSSDFAALVSGYPKGATLPSSVYTGQWLNLNEANSNSPESSTGATTGWVPVGNYGVTSVSGLSGTSTILSSLQAAKERIILTGALTANINLTFPTWTKSWTIVNNCTGAFSVTCKTLSGTGVAIPAGQTALITGDGVNIIQDANLLGIPGRLLGKQEFKTSGIYTPSLGTRSIIVEVIGGGGGGGGIPSAPGAGVAAAGGGGGGYGRKRITSGFTGVSVTIGSGGVGASNANGASGSSTSFGSLLIATGGVGGGAGSSSSTVVIAVGVPGSGGSCPLADTYKIGGWGGVGLIGPAFAQGGCGGDTYWAPQTRGTATINTSVSSGNNAENNHGAGGSGAIGLNSGTAAAGGNGGSGLVIVWEYS